MFCILFFYVCFDEKVYNNIYTMIERLVGVSDASHATHDTENVVVNSVDTDLGSSSSGNCRSRKNKLENSVVNSGEVAGS